MSEPQQQQLIESIAAFFANGGQFSTIVKARSYIADLTGTKIQTGTIQAKQADEAIESGLIRAASQIVRQSETTHEAFDRLVDLYNRQPNLSVRSSTSILQQAYSTPVPIAYLAGVLAGLTPNQTVYEPTAGHGALLFEANPARAIVNELNPDRAADLRQQGYTVTETDASIHALDRQVDVVIMNPPFGVMRDSTGASREWTVRGGNATKAYRTTQIDHAIAFQGLQAMKDDGRAVIILGAPMAMKTGNLESASTTYNSGQNRAFYKNLYDNYRVVQHFCIAGDLYKRQGTTFPIQIIAIDGRGRSERILPAADLPAIYTTFDELRELIPNVPRQTLRLDSPDSRIESAATRDRVESDRSDRFTPELPHGATRGSSRVDDSASQSNRGRELSDSDSVSVEPSSTLSDSSTGSTRRADSLGTSFDDTQHRASESPEFPLPPGHESRTNANQLSFDVPPSSERNDRANRGNLSFGLAGSSGGTVPNDGLNLETTFAASPEMNSENLETESVEVDIQDVTQVEYKPRSGATPVGTLAPTNMQSAMDNALKQLELKVGSIDDYVADRLKISDRETLYSRFSAEQIDALGLAISNLEKNEAFIIGDQTGVGKGRFVAGVIEYARLQGLTPIFVTQKPDLYADIMRDLHDVGVNDLLPVLTNNGVEVPLPTGETLKTAGAIRHRALLNSMTASGDLGEYNAIFTTYAQMQTVKGEMTNRHEFLWEFAPKSILIFDESHNAGGSPNADGLAEGRAGFARRLVTRSAGVVYSSATYAKSPFVMTLYAIKTGMRHAVDNPENLVGMVQSGKIPLQQAIASKLAESGQYVRRERSYDGIEFGAKVAPVDQQMANNLSWVMSQIMEFDRAKQQALKILVREAKASASRVSTDNSIGAAGATSTNFTSLMHNVISQTLLALKAEATVQEALESLRRGEKPVITVSNTMGSFIGDAAETQDLDPGDPINLSVGDLLRRYLNSSRMISIKDYDGKVLRRSLTDDELAGEALDLYDHCSELIDDIDWGDLPISPIDYITNRLKEEGYRVGEITGRKDCIEYGAEGSQFYRVRNDGETSTKASIHRVGQFNSGDLDVMILNRSGATGISLHASAKFIDQRPRRMIIAQAELNIDDFMQMLGRIHRTGQVENPRFTILMGDIPAEKRPMGVLLKKMASLNANTTAARESGFALGDVTDFMNEYGDQVALELLATQPGLNRKLGQPIQGVSEDSELDQFDADGLIHKFTGRIPLLSVAEQERIYSLLEREYQEFVQREEAMGQSVLKAEQLDLDAKTLARMEIIPAKKEIASPFTGAAYLEVIDAKALRKPMTQLEVINAVRVRIELEAVESLDDHSRYSFEQHSKSHTLAEIKALKQRVKEYRNQQKTALESKPVNPDSDSEEQADKIRKSIAHLDKKLEKQRDHVAVTMRKFNPGQSVRIVSKDNLVLYGVVEGYLDRTATSGSPVLPSSWFVQIQIADSTHQLTMPLSKVNTDRLNGIRLEAADRTLFTNVDIYELFDQKQTMARENRQIFTGNVIRAFEQYPNGKFVNFTDSKGNVRQGLLMKAGFDIEQVLKERPVQMPSPEVCLEFWSKMNRERLQTQDKFLTVWKNDAGTLTLVAERAKSKGGKYYLDQGLMEAAQAEFVSFGNTLQLSVERKQIDAVLQYLYDAGMPLYSFTAQRKAREMLGIELPIFESPEQMTAALLAELPVYVEELEHPADQAAVVSRLESLLTLNLDAVESDLKPISQLPSPESIANPTVDVQPIPPSEEAVSKVVEPGTITPDMLPSGNVLATASTVLEFGAWGNLTSVAIEFEDFLYVHVTGLTANCFSYPDPESLYAQSISRDDWMAMNVELHDLQRFAQFAGEQRHAEFMQTLNQECDRIAPSLNRQLRLLTWEEISQLLNRGEDRKKFIQNVLDIYPDSDRVQFNSDFRVLAIATVTDKLCEQLRGVVSLSPTTIKETPSTRSEKPERTKTPEKLEKPVTRILPSKYQMIGPESNVAKLLDQAGLAEAIFNAPDNEFHLRVENEPYIPLVIERHGNQLFLTHYIEQNGDLITDNEMVFGIRETGHLDFQEVSIRDPFHGGLNYSPDRSFARMFARNLIDQQFGKAAKVQQDQKSERFHDEAPTSQVSPALSHPIGEAERNAALLLEQSGLSDILLNAGGKPGNEFKLHVEIDSQTMLSVSRYGDKLSLAKFVEHDGESICLAQVVFEVSKTGSLKFDFAALRDYPLIKYQQAQKADYDFAHQFSHNLLLGNLPEVLKAAHSSSQPVQDAEKSVAVESPKPKTGVDSTIASEQKSPPPALESTGESIIAKNSKRSQKSVAPIEEVQLVLEFAPEPPKLQPLKSEPPEVVSETVAPPVSVPASSGSAAVVDFKPVDSSGYSPSLREMRDWLMDAQVVDQKPKYIARIIELSQEMLSKTSQFALPVEQRDPKFVNPDFVLSEKAMQAMQADRAASYEIRTPTRAQLKIWYTAATDKTQLERIRELGQAQIKGTEQAKLPVAERDLNFKNPKFQLSHSDYLKMRQMVQTQQDQQKRSANGRD